MIRKTDAGRGQLRDEKGELGMALLDHDHLTHQTMNDRDLQRELLGMFQRQMTEKMAELLRPDVVVSAVAHSIKGSARGIGAFAIADLAEALEQAKGLDIALVEELQEAVAATDLEINAFLSK